MSSDIASVVQRVISDCDLEEQHMPAEAAGVFLFPTVGSRDLLLSTSGKFLHFIARDSQGGFNRAGCVSNPEGIADLLLWFAYGREWIESNLALGNKTESLTPPNNERMVSNAN